MIQNKTATGKWQMKFSSSPVVPLIVLKATKLFPIGALIPFGALQKALQWRENHHSSQSLKI